MRKYILFFFFLFLAFTPLRVFAAPIGDIDCTFGGPGCDRDDGGLGGGGTGTTIPNDPLGGGKMITVPGNPNFQPSSSLSVGSGAAGGGTPITNLFSTILGFFTIIGGFLFLLYFVMGALTWLSSGGEKGKIEKARSQLVNAAIGLIIIIIAQSITGIVGGVLGLDILNPVNSLQGLFK